jgi:hypothetical protein
MRNQRKESVLKQTAIGQVLLSHARTKKGAMRVASQIAEHVARCQACMSQPTAVTRTILALHWQCAANLMKLCTRHLTWQLRFHARKSNMYGTKFECCICTSTLQLLPLPQEATITSSGSQVLRRAAAVTPGCCWWGNQPLTHSGL